MQAIQVANENSLHDMYPQTVLYGLFSSHNNGPNIKNIDWKQEASESFPTSHTIP
jgi:hypothetical protein